MFTMTWTINLLPANGANFACSVDILNGARGFDGVGMG
jgi:hypothetical protein